MFNRPVKSLELKEARPCLGSLACYQAVRPNRLI